MDLSMIQRVLARVGYPRISAKYEAVLGLFANYLSEDLFGIKSPVWHFVRGDCLVALSRCFEEYPYRNWNQCQHYQEQRKPNAYIGNFDSGA